MPQSEWSIIGYYSDTDECIIAHTEGESVEDALRSFFSDEECGQLRRDDVKIMAVLSGYHYDCLSHEVGEGRLTYADLADRLTSIGETTC